MQNTFTDTTESERNDPQTNPDIRYSHYDVTGRNVIVRPQLGVHDEDTPGEESSEDDDIPSTDVDQVLAIPASVVTIDCALDDSDGDDSSPAAFAERRRHDRDMLALSRMLNAHPEGDEDQIEYRTGWSTRLMTPDSERPAFPPVRHRFPSTMKRVSSQSDGGLAPLAPHAKFFIDSESNRCSIVFDPPL